MSPERERSEPLPRSHGVWALSGLLLLVTLFVLVLVLVSGNP